MKRFIAAILTLISLCWAIDAGARFPRGTPASSNPNLRQENIFGLKGSAWQDPTNYYVPGTGSPAVSTSDYYHVDGAYWLRPYDLLDSACGSAGATIAATAGKGRYVWFTSPDHPAGTPWADATGYWMGFSNDPGVMPSTVTNILRPYASNPLATIANVTASIAGTTLTVTAATGWISFDNNAVVTGSGVTQASIVQQLTNTDTRPGGKGTYQISVSQTVGSQAMVISQQNYLLYMTPYLTCNPDDATYPFYIYGEGSADRTLNETGVIRSADLVTFQPSLPTHVVYSFGPFSSYQKVVRTAVNTWYSVGYQANFPQNAGVYGYAKWTSSDGIIWTPPGTNYSACLPANPTGPAGNQPCNATTATFSVPSAAPPRTTVGAQDYAITHTNSMTSSVRIGSQWVTRTPIDASFNAISSPAITNVSSAYAGVYPGPTYLNAVSGYVEDGVVHYYASTGFPKGGTSGLGVVSGATYLNGGLCLSVPVANGQQGYFSLTGSISGTTLTVSALIANSVVVGGQLEGANVTNGTIVTGQIDATHYTVSPSQTAASATIVGNLCGGLAQQGNDYYTEITDSSAAAGAAPIGVQASCSSSVAALSWYAALPQQTYRLYRGTTAGSQTTLVGDFTGTSATDSGMTLNAVTYYKLVYLHSGVEQKNRVVSTYCSTSSAFVNAHLTRASAGGADMTTCNRAGTGLSLDAFDNWLTSNGLSSNLLFATAADFCVAKSGSVITKIFDMGTTRLPRGGDYTPTTANTTYNATGINGKPAWVNTATAYGYYGSGRFNNIRRKTQITLFAAYQKPGTAVLNPFSIGQFNSRMQLSHTAGAPGGISCLIADATHPVTAPATVSGLATDVHTASCTFDGTSWTAWSDAVAGSGQPGLVIPSPNLINTDMLTGQIDNNVSSGSNANVLMSGTDAGLYNYTTGYTNAGNAAATSFRAQMVFDKALSGAQITSLDALVR